LTVVAERTTVEVPHLDERGSMAEVHWENLGDKLLAVDGVWVARVVIDPADSDEAAEMLLEPLPTLAERMPEAGIDDSWTVTYDRVNAQIGLRRGPRKLIGVWVAIRDLASVHGTLYRARR
jgi:hypothetical protein